MRVVMVCGKGGSGKSTLATATALQAAHEGARTLLLSLDPAHSLAAILGQPVGADPTPIAERLWASELDPLGGLSETLAEVMEYAEGLARSQFPGPPAGAELAFFPGLTELAGLARIEAHVTSGAFDAVVVDHAPTAFAMRLLALPTLVQAYGRKGRQLFERHAGQFALGLTMLGPGLPTPPPAVLNRAWQVLERLEALPPLLSDPAVTSAHLVCPPDAVGLAETRSLHTMLSLHGIPVEGLWLNALWPDTVNDPVVEAWREREAEALALARERFAPVSVMPVTRRSEPLVGLATLQAFSRAVWGANSVLAARARRAALRITREGTGIEVAQHLPHVDRQAVDLAKHGDELYITVKGHQRIVRLPADAGPMTPTRARFSDDTLLVTLTPGA